MSSRSYCDRCGESYHEDNLLECSSCRREFCYRCGDWNTRRCDPCERLQAKNDSPPPPQDQTTIKP